MDVLALMRHVDLPLASRSAPVQTVDAEKRTVDVVFSTGATVRRARYEGWDTRVAYDETILVSEDAINMDRLRAGAPILDSHSSYTTRSQVGVVDKAWIEGGLAMARVRFPSAGVDPSADRMWGLVAEGIVRNVSVGYSTDKIRIVEPEKRGDVEKWIVERWTPHEISFVTIPADPKAQVRSADGSGHPALIVRDKPAAPSLAPAASARMRMLQAALRRF